MIDIRPVWITSDAEPVRLGIACGCPFCLARLREVPKIGAEFVLLSSFDIGQRGRVVRAGPSSLSEIHLRMDGEPPEWLRRVDPVWQLYLEARLFRTLAWAPPLSLEDTLALHEIALDVLSRPSGRRGPSISDIARAITSVAWWARLPVSADEIWPMLEAHGVRGRGRIEFIRLFDFGQRLLVANHGRKPNSRKRMSPMSRAKYVTGGQRRLRAQFRPA